MSLEKVLSEQEQEAQAQQKQGTTSPILMPEHMALTNRRSM
jgi:hypothetical protein